MAADSLDAFHRHREDHDVLYDRSRWANASYLCGLAAECGLKAVMVALGMEVGPRGVPVSREHRVHIPQIWSAFISFVSGTNGAGLATIISQNCPMAGWRIHDRYEPRSSFNQQQVDNHRLGLVEVDRMVQMARLLGFL